MDLRAWTECHVEAFAFFGGIWSTVERSYPEFGARGPVMWI